MERHVLPVGSSDRVSLMHAPKQRRCCFTDEVIKKGELALTFSTSGQSGNAWMKLDRLGKVIDTLEEIYELDKYGVKGSSNGAYATGRWHECEVMGDVTVAMFSSGEIVGECLVCEEDTGRNVNVLAVNFTFGAREVDPWVHGKCVESLKQGLEQVEQSDRWAQIMSHIL